MKALCPAPQQFCPCAACVAASGVHLLATGRAGMALRVLDGLPDAIRKAVAEVYSQGVEHGLNAMRKARPRNGASAPFAAVASPLVHHAEQDDGADDADRNDEAVDDELQELHAPPPSRSGTTNRPGRGSLPAPRGRSAKRAASAAKVTPRGVTPPAPAFAKLAAELAAHVEDLGADRVAEALGVALDDLGPMLEGRVGPPASGMRKLRETTG